MIVCVGLSPTVQKTLRLTSLSVGSVNRAREVIVSASGKAVNVARVLTLLGDDVLLVQPLGGDTGRFVARQLKAENIAHETLWLDDAPTRTCTTLLPDDGPATELVEEAPPLTAALVEDLANVVESHLPGAEALCLSGSLPRGAPSDLYARLISAAGAHSVPAFVDAQGVPLRSALATRPFFVKPNRDEAAGTLDLTLSGNEEQDALAAVAALTGAGAAWALVSLGKSGALLGDAGAGRWRLTPPVVQAVNPIGSGDSLLAGLVHALITRQASVPDAAIFGTACGAANCLTPTSGVVNGNDVARLLPQVRLIQLP